MTTRVIGVGEPAVGDDGVGQAVMDALAEMSLPPGTALCRVREASALVDLLCGVDCAVVIDAIVDDCAPGTVQLLEVHQLDGAAQSGVSSHGIGVVQALGLAQALADDVAEQVWFVAISIARPTHYQHGLSHDVAAAVARASAIVRRLLNE